MSMTMFPDGPLIGTLAPIAAASGSSIRYASLAPALSAASRTARFSTEVTPAGTQIITSGPRDADAALRRLVDEEPEHRLGDDVVGDDAVLHRPDRVDVAGRAPDHLAGFLAHGHDPVVVVDRDDRRLRDHDALAFDVDEDVGRAEIDADLHAGVVTRPPSSDALRSWRRVSRNLRSMFSYPR